MMHQQVARYIVVMTIVAPPRPPLFRGRETITTLAQLAGVAPSTVSRALRGDARISEPTRRRIEALAVERGYLPNVLARTLSSGRSGLIGLVLGSVENPFYAELMQQAVAEAASRGRRLILVHAGSGPIEDETAHSLLHYQVDGCLISSAEMSSRAARVCADHGVPVVMVNRVPRMHANVVACDNEKGGRDLAGFLLAGGHRRFMTVRGNASSSTTVERERGFSEVVRAAGCEDPPLLNGWANYEGGFAAGEHVARMSAEERPDAVFAVSDIMAMGMIDALRLAGLHVPGDISIVGFDGIVAAARPPYAITTVAQPLPAMIARALDMLMARIENAGLGDEVARLPGELIIRRSARLPPDG